MLRLTPSIMASTAQFLHRSPSGCSECDFQDCAVGSEYQRSNYDRLMGLLINLSVRQMNWVGTLHKSSWRWNRQGRILSILKIMVWLSPCHLRSGVGASFNPLPLPLTKLVLVCYSYVGTCKKYTDLKIAKIKHRAPPIQSQYSTLISKSMHCQNPLIKGFILSHFEQVGCVGYHGVLEPMGTVGISNILCRVPCTYPPKW